MQGNFLGSTTCGPMSYYLLPVGWVAEEFCFTLTSHIPRRHAAATWPSRDKFIHTHSALCVQGLPWAGRWDAVAM